MRTEIIIEKINHENFKDFLILVKMLAIYEKLDPPSEKARVRLRKDGLSDCPKYEAYLAKFKDSYVGYVIYFMSYSSFLALPSLYLEDIFILKEYRNKGAGQQLFNFCVKKAKEKNCGRIEWHVLDCNKSGLKFYKKINAKHLSEWHYYRLRQDDFDKFL